MRALGPRAGVCAVLAVATKPDRRPLAEEDILVGRLVGKQFECSGWVRDATEQYTK